MDDTPRHSRAFLVLPDLYETRQVRWRCLCGGRFPNGKTYLTDKETDLLEKLAARLSGEDFATMQAILKKYKEPRRKDK